MSEVAENGYLLFIDDSKNGIDDTTLEAVEKRIGQNRAKNLFLILQSGGGSPYSAVAIMNILGAHFDKIFAIVPKSAKSAATLMALGTDEIYMQERSALGPLDLPIEHPRDGSRISALDVINITTSMTSLAETIAKKRYDYLRNDLGGISKREAVQIALDHANEFTQPIVQQIDPYHLQKAHREITIGTRYAQDMLLSRMMKDNYVKALKTAKALVYDFPVHEYSIYSEYAQKNLGLTIKKLTALQPWNNDLKDRYEKACQETYHIEYGILPAHVPVSPEKPAERPKKTATVEHA